MAGKYIETEVYVDLEEFDDDKILDEVEKRVCNDNFLQYLLSIDKVKEKLRLELEDNLSSINHWGNQETAKTFFESLSFASSLKNWILKTYQRS